MDLAAVERNLAAINRIVGMVHPLGSIVINAIGLLIKFAKKSKFPIGSFEAEFMQFSMAWNELGAATAAFREEFGTKEHPINPMTGPSTIGG